MARKLSFDVLLRTALVDSRNARTGDVSKSELARRLGVSRSSITRWLEGKEPKAETLERIRAPLQKTYTRVRERATAQNRRVKAKLPPMAIPFQAKRQKIKDRDPITRKVIPGKFIYSDWLNIDVQHYTIDAIFDLLRSLRDASEIIQIVYRVPRGGTSLGGREYRAGGNSATSMQQITPRLGDAELWERTLGAIYDHKDKKKLAIRYVAVLRTNAKR